MTVETERLVGCLDSARQLEGGGVQSDSESATAD